ncbi:MAG: CDP-glycerol glycerophosphotransferase family protein [Lachnospiraceae bacterium]|nr:CDP-glycerol glycerophosphotransferase family protein [Lachnospiraceae bacterium]
MVKKEITFIYLDTVQKQVYEMIASEAKKRGYKVRLTNNRFAKCEIGWYCEHVNFPRYSKFSIIMLHDLMQQFGNWPDIWWREPWDKYDIGFLPSNVWAENWKKCSQNFYANPKKGVYLTGWPKADRLKLYMDDNKKKQVSDKIGLDSTKPTILYAPAWENDNKQDEFVQAMLKLDVNILIKQIPWPDSYVEQIKNINEMYELHKSNSRVRILDRMSNILDAIMVSDILVSDESSTMSEAVMLGKPAISVNNWMIPDVNPSRFPANDYEYVIKTDKEELTDCVARVLNNYEKYQMEAKKYSDNHFSNIGNCISIMLDILDAEINGEKCKYLPLTPEKTVRLSIRKKISFYKNNFLRDLAFDYSENNRILNILKKLYKKMRNK